MAAALSLRLVALLLAAAAAVQHGGGACGTDWDCSLGGVCNATTKLCACDVWFTGNSCHLLNLQRAKPSNGLDYDGWSSWGGHAVRSDTDQLWHGYFSLMAGECTLGAYRTNSGSVAATAAAVDGPYTVKAPAQPDAAANWAVAPPSHCTQIKRHPSGEYHLWHILPGNGDGECKNCSAGPTSVPAADADAMEHARPFAQNLWVHTAPTPTGPWSKQGVQINVTDFKPGTTASQSWCSAPFYYPNGTALLIWGGQGGGGIGAGLWAGVADDWKGPYKQYVERRALANGIFLVCGDRVHFWDSSHQPGPVRCRVFPRTPSNLLMPAGKGRCAAGPWCRVHGPQ